MRTRHLTAALILAILAGCDGPPNPKPGPATPHNGSLVALPDGLGFVEILKEADPARRGQSKVVAYFLDPSKNPLAAVTTVSLKSQASGGKAVDFKPAGDAGPAKAGAMISSSFSDRGEVEGDLTATIGGKPITVPINVR